MRPVTEVAKAITVLEAVVGQLYLVVAVAWLVGMDVSKKSKYKTSFKRFFEPWHADGGGLVDGGSRDVPHGC